MKAIIYRRVSTAEQSDDPMNLEKQQNLCTEFCRHKGFEIQQIFTDVESARTDDRPQFQEMIGFCKRNKGKIHCLVVQKVIPDCQEQRRSRCLSSLARRVRCKGTVCH